MSVKIAPRIIVVGGSVVDLVFRSRELPEWHQAVQAHSFRMYPGGKGLNQAIASAKLGATASLLSAVGDDELGDRVLEYLELNRVSRKLIQVVKGGYTDVTCIVVNDLGEPAFVGWKGMTVARVNRAHIRDSEVEIRQADALLITFEVSLEAVREAVRIAKKHEKLVVLNPAPPLDALEPPPYDLVRDVDIVISNRWEAARLLRVEDADPKELAIKLRDMGARIACVTSPQYGCAVAAEGPAKEFPSLLVGDPVDTTGGSDAFCVAASIALLQGAEIETVVTYAEAVASLAVGEPGGSPSMPTAKHVQRMLTQRGISLGLSLEHHDPDAASNSA